MLFGILLHIDILFFQLFHGGQTGFHLGDFIFPQNFPLDQFTVLTAQFFCFSCFGSEFCDLQFEFSHLAGECLSVCQFL